MTKVQHLKLVKQHIQLTMKIKGIEKTLRENYKQNPIKCSECGKVLKWSDFNGYVSFDHDGLRLEICDCDEGMG